MVDVTIDGVIYEFDSLGEVGKAQFLSLQATDAEIQRVQSLLAMTQTARNVFATDLSSKLAAHTSKAAQPGKKSGSKDK